MSRWEDRFHKVMMVVMIGLQLLAVFVCSSIVLTSADPLTVVSFAIIDAYVLYITWRAIQEFLIGLSGG